jgi:pyruvate/2-oxoacid:ferredoxin oxidoreductase beta subunit
MTNEIMIAGFGGQGVMAIGKTLAEAGMKEGKGYTFVEVLACCPTNWGKTPAASVEWLKENMIPYFPLGVYKDIDAEVK